MSDEDDDLVDDEQIELDGDDQPPGLDEIDLKKMMHVVVWRRCWNRSVWKKNWTISVSDGS